MNYSVYKHTFPNNKVYIGITCQNPEDRWDNGRGYVGQPRIARAIIEYGWDNIDHKILFDNLTETEAKEIEAKLIAEYKSNIFRYGYNVSASGIHDKKNENDSTDSYVYVPENGVIYQNQWTVKINNPNYPKTCIQEAYNAMQYIDGVAFKLYVYLCNNKDGHIIALDPKDVVKVTGMSRKSYTRAKAQLVEKGYLVCKQGNSYDFYTNPVTV